MALLLAFLTPGCVWFMGGKAFTDLMKKMPIESTSFDYWAIEMLDKDEDLRRNIYPKFKESSEAEQLKDIRALDKVKYSGKA